MTATGKRVLLYTTSLLIAPMPMMPFAIGTREGAWAMLASSAILTPVSFYCARGLLRQRYRMLWETKMLVASIGTGLLGILMAAASVFNLSR